MPYSILVITQPASEQVRLLLLLTAAGYVPTCCDCLEAALTALRSATYDAVLTDAVILDTPPGKMAAVELVSLLKEQSCNPDTPVLVMGDPISFQHMMDTLRSGVARFIPKPFTLPDLLETISAELALNAYQRKVPFNTRPRCNRVR